MAAWHSSCIERETQHITHYINVGQVHTMHRNNLSLLLKVLAICLITISTLAQLIVILITTLVTMLDSPPDTTSVTHVLQNDSSVHIDEHLHNQVAMDDTELDYMADLPVFVDEPMTMLEIVALTDSLDVAAPVYVSMQWNGLRSYAKSVGVTGCKTREQYLDKLAQLG